MSKATKRKHVFNEIQCNGFDLPKADQKVVRILESRGNNLHLVRDSIGNEFLVSMPTKFRRNVWVKRGDHVLIDPIQEGNKVKGEISTIVGRHALKRLIREGYWIGDENESDNKRDSEDEDLNREFVNPNRPPAFDEDSSSDSE